MGQLFTVASYFLSITLPMGTIQRKFVTSNSDFFKKKPTQCLGGLTKAFNDAPRPT